LRQADPEKHNQESFLCYLDSVLAQRATSAHERKIRSMESKIRILIIGTVPTASKRTINDMEIDFFSQSRHIVS
jgi:hypothetical protein